ncbi:hypothetical protein CCZ27_21405 [Thauera sinica]|nr:hypothetical protein CCZ27_21405 [Thauera sp. K11]
MGATVLVLAGCTTVRIESALDPAAVRVERHWGVLAVDVPGAMQSYVADITSVGFSHGPFGWTAGYARHGWAALGNECRLVVWVAAREHLEAVRALANANAGLCAVPAP